MRLHKSELQATGVEMIKIDPALSRLLDPGDFRTWCIDANDRHDYLDRMAMSGAVAGSPSVASLLLLLWWNTGTKGLHIVVRARDGMRCRQQRPTSNLLMPDNSMRGRETPNGIRQCAVTMSRAKRLLSCNIVANELLTIIDQEPKGSKHSAAPTQWEFIDKSIRN